MTQKTPAKRSTKTSTRAKKPAAPPADPAEGAGAAPEDDELDGEPTGKGRSLVIVESPAKAKTINKYLGRDFVVKASMGHIRDLPKGKFGIDIEHGSKPAYT